MGQPAETTAHRPDKAATLSDLRHLFTWAQEATEEGNDGDERARATLTKLLASVAQYAETTEELNALGFIVLDKEKDDHDTTFHESRATVQRTIKFVKEAGIRL